MKTDLWRNKLRDRNRRPRCMRVRKPSVTSPDCLHRRTRLPSCTDLITIVYLITALLAREFLWIPSKSAYESQFYPRRKACSTPSDSRIPTIGSTTDSCNLSYRLSEGFTEPCAFFRLAQYERTSWSLNFDRFIPSPSVGDRKPNREFSHFEGPRKREAGHHPGRLSPFFSIIGSRYQAERLIAGILADFFQH